MWRKSRLPNVSVIECCSDRIAAIRVILDSVSFLMFNVNIPWDKPDHLSEFTDCLASVCAIIEEQNIPMAFAIGDFDAHPSATFGKELFTFCKENDLICANLEILGPTSNTYTFPNEEVANFICQLCMKTFYNEIALKNHKNMTHDVGKENWNDNIKYLSEVNGMHGFQFIPLNPEEEGTKNPANGFVIREFARDTSFLIVKVDTYEAESSKKCQSDDHSDKENSNDSFLEKSSVDIRGPFTCTLPSTKRQDLQCRRIFFSCCEYSIHYRNEHTKRRKATLRCQVCEKRLDRDQYVAARVAIPQAAPAQFHAPPANTQTFSCRPCGLTFVDDTKFDEHNRIMHGKMKPYQCVVCFKRFTQHGGLQQHMRNHSGIRPFTCTFCPKSFTQKAGLDQHLRTHTKVKPFKCVICGKCFSQSVHLRQHMRTHTNIQPFECSGCGKRFKQRSHLNFHLRSHLSGTLLPACLPQEQRSTEPINFLNLSNLQPVQAPDGGTIYYASDMPPYSTTDSPTSTSNPNYFLNY